MKAFDCTLNLGCIPEVRSDAHTLITVTMYARNLGRSALKRNVNSPDRPLQCTFEVATFARRQNRRPQVLDLSNLGRRRATRRRNVKLRHL